jgi:hypothetical protein
MSYLLVPTKVFSKNVVGVSESRVFAPDSRILNHIALHFHLHPLPNNYTTDDFSTTLKMGIASGVGHFIQSILEVIQGIFATILHAFQFILQTFVDLGKGIVNFVEGTLGFAFRKSLLEFSQPIICQRLNSKQTTSSSWARWQLSFSAISYTPSAKALLLLAGPSRANRQDGHKIHSHGEELVDLWRPRRGWTRAEERLTEGSFHWSGIRPVVSDGTAAGFVQVRTARYGYF